MSAIRQATRDLVVDGIAAALQAIEDPTTRDRVVRAVTLCDEALEEIDALDLGPYELLDEGTPDLSVWEALAPSVRNILIAVRKASTQLAELFPSAGPPTESMDLEFDLDDLIDTGALPPIRDKREQELDDLVEKGSADEAVGETIAVLASMLQSDIAQFGVRLRNPRVTADRWFLLGELQEMRSKCTQCLEAVVASMISSYTDEDLMTVLPRYATSTRRAIRLRTIVVDLSFDVSRWNAALVSANVTQAKTIRSALAERLEAFAASASYPDIRPQDKRTLIDFRQRLAAYTDVGSQMRQLAQDVEGMSKFLEVMRAINQREVLLSNDYDRLQTIRMLLESEVDVEEIVEHLEDVYGRWPPLDDFVRLARQQRYPEPEDVLPIVVEAQESLRGF